MVLFYSPFFKNISGNLKEQLGSIGQGSSKNFGASVSLSDNSKLIDFDNNCESKVKYSNNYLAVLTTELTPSIVINSTQNKEEIKINCLRTDKLIDKFKLNILKNYDNSPDVQKKLKLSKAELSVLTDLDFYKLYTSSYDPNCIKTKGVNELKFLNQSVSTNTEDQYSFCNNNTTPEFESEEYYLFNKDKINIIYIKITNPKVNKSKFLIY